MRTSVYLLLLVGHCMTLKVGIWDMTEDPVIEKDKVKILLHEYWMIKNSNCKKKLW